MASAGQDATVKIWNVADWKLLFSFTATDSVCGLRFCPEDAGKFAAVGADKLLVFGGADKNITVLKMKTANNWTAVKGGEKAPLHNDWVSSVAFNISSNHFASGSLDNTINICKWENELLSKPQTLKGHLGWVNGVAFHPNKDELYSVSQDKTVKIWSLEGKLLWSSRNYGLVLEGVNISGATLSPQNQLLIK